MVALCLAVFALSLQGGVRYGLLNAVGLGIGSVALVAMSLCLLLAARPSFLEPFFGGLDRMYHFHKWSGIAALGAMVLHEQTKPDVEDYARETLLGEVGASLGEVTYYPLMVLIVLSWVKRFPLIDWEIPYHLWWFSHRLMGAFFAIAAVHYWLVDVPPDWGGGLTLLLNICAATGILSYAFTEFIARKWRRRAYTVSSVERQPGATAVTLRPVGRAMRWRAGQFAFLNIVGASSAEAHPFSLAGGPNPAGTIHFEIKPLGDWTRRLPDRLQPGSQVQVEGPYGRFDFRKGGQRQIWVAGGIGITPFLAWAQSLSPGQTRQIHLVYSSRTSAEVIGRDVLVEAAEHVSGFSFDLAVTETDGRLDAGRVIAGAPFDTNGADIFFCGPAKLRATILKGLESRGISPRAVYFEMFEFR
jgi:predicted ferric reductase